MPVRRTRWTAWSWPRGQAGVKHQRNSTAHDGIAAIENPSKHGATEHNDRSRNPARPGCGPGGRGFESPRSPFGKWLHTRRFIGRSGRSDRRRSRQGINEASICPRDCRPFVGARRRRLECCLPMRSRRDAGGGRRLAEELRLVRLAQTSSFSRSVRSVYWPEQRYSSGATKKRVVSSDGRSSCWGGLLVRWRRPQLTLRRGESKASISKAAAAAQGMLA
jgi:hypothetical protein